MSALRIVCLSLCLLQTSTLLALSKSEQPARPATNAFARVGATGQEAVWNEMAFIPDNSDDISAAVSADDFVLLGPRSVTGLSAWLTDDEVNDDGVLGSFGGTLGWAIYSDSAGQPGTLLYSGQDTAPMVTDTGVQDAFDADIARVDVAFPSAITLPTGTYWLALHEGNWGSAFDGSKIWWQWARQVGAIRVEGSPETAPATWSPSSGPVDDAFALWGASAWDEGSIDPANSDDISTVAVANDVVLRSARTVSGFGAWLTDDAVNDNGLLDSFTGTLGWAIYADAAGQPGTLLGSGQAAPLLVDTGLQDGFDADIVRAEVAFPSPLTLPAGAYWFALHEGAWGDAFDGSTLWWQWAARAPGAVSLDGSPATNPLTWVPGGSPVDQAFVWWSLPTWDQSPFSQENSEDVTTEAVANDFTLTTAQAVNGVSAWFADDAVNDNNVLDSFAGTLGWAIYSDASGQPGTLLFSGQDNAPVVSDTGADDDFGADIARIDIALPAVPLPAGTYWLALREGAWGSPGDGSTLWWEWASANRGAFTFAGTPVTGPASWTASATPDDGAFLVWTALSDRSISKTDGAAAVTAGDQVTYTLTVTNAGPDAEPSATVADTFPAVLSGCSTTSTASGGPAAMTRGRRSATSATPVSSCPPAAPSPTPPSATSRPAPPAALPTRPRSPARAATRTAPTTARRTPTPS